MPRQLRGGRGPTGRLARAERQAQERAQSQALRRRTRAKAEQSTRDMGAVGTEPIRRANGSMLVRWHCRPNRAAALLLATLGPNRILANAPGLATVASLHWRGAVAR